jgi:anti-anti-sigma factor
VSAQDEQTPGGGPPKLEFDEEIGEGIRVLALHGFLELGTAARLEEPLTRAAGDADRALVVDLSDCRFVDSVGLATLLQGAKPLQNGEANVAFVARDGPVRRLLALTAVDRTIPVFATVPEARAAVLDPG